MQTPDYLHPFFLRFAKQIMADNLNIVPPGDGRYLDERIGIHGEGIHIGCVQEQDFSLEHFVYYVSELPPLRAAN
jgi:hypothetical protein